MHLSLMIPHFILAMKRSTTNAAFAHWFAAPPVKLTGCMELIIVSFEVGGPTKGVRATKELASDVAAQADRADDSIHIVIVLKGWDEPGVWNS